MAGTTEASPSRSPTGPNNQRRVVKALAPPPLSTVERVEKDTDGDTSSPRPSHNMVPPIRDAAVLHETQQELEERWRQERLDASRELQKQHRHDELEQRRKQQDNNAKPTSMTIATETTERTFAYSVEPEHPEHKRKVEKASLLPNRPLEEPLDKRHRVEDDEKEEGNDTDKDMWWNHILVKAAFGAVAVVIIGRFLFGKRK